MQKELTYEITNIAGVERAELKLRPGINVLKGRNASGKTSSMRAIVRAQGGEVEIERRDGSQGGEVRGPGVRLHVGKVTRRTGHAELSLADVSPLSTLIDPGFKDSEAAARARVRALIDLLALGVDDEKLEELCQGDAELLEWLHDEVQENCVEDLMGAAEKLRHYAHARAREQESAVSEAEGRSASASEQSRELLDRLGGPDRLTDKPVEEADQELVNGSRAYERAVAQCEAREELEARQTEIRGTIGERPDSRAVESLIDDLAAERAEIGKEIQRLNEALTKAQALDSAKASAIRAAQEKAEELREAAARWDEAQAVLARPLEGPTREELEDVQKRLVDLLTVQQEHARLSRDYRSAQQRKQEARSARDLARLEAERLRALAAAIPDQLGKILSAAGAGGLTVIDGRLHALIDGKPLDFERRLSDGQRIRIALDIAASTYGEKVVPISGAYWTALDPENRAAFAKMATERGLFALTEEPADGELRVEHEDAA